MPRPKNPGAPEPKKRSRTGCWTCKAKKVKCGEEKPRCLNCDKNGEKFCDYSIRLNWEGRSKRKANELTPEPQDQGVSSNRGGQIQMLSFQPPISGPPKSKTADSPTPIDPALSATEFLASPRDLTMQFTKPQKFPSSRPSSAGSAKGSTISSPAVSSAGPTSVGFPPGQMLPPFSTVSQARSEALAGPDLRDSKRARPSPTSQPAQLGMNSPGYLSPQGHLPVMPVTSGPFSSAKQDPAALAGTFGKNVPPLTPSNSSVASEDIYSGSQLKPPASPLPFFPNDPRRLSVNSLLTQEAEAKASGELMDVKSQLITYGMDRGLPDLDIPKNDDVKVLDIVTPVMSTYAFSDDNSDPSAEFGFGLFGLEDNKDLKGYPEPISVSIPSSLHPLPALLHDNKMNLMYFHFFMEFTARILVPHDCPENPFKIILPQMAVRDDNLLHLLLAYSASHRARHLGHPEPTNRIAHWVKDVFPNLRHALNDSTQQISNANLATAIMLASLEIIAPNTFEVAVPWQNHLSMARSMIIARGGPATVNRNKDRVSYFLIRWFAYLDVLGNFSSTGTKADHAMFSPELYDFQEKNDFQIDCVLGFSGYLASVLAKISDLARQCDQNRIDASGTVDPTWQPSLAVQKKAERIKSDLQNVRLDQFVLCPHKQPGSEQEMTQEANEMNSTNEAFFWAGLIHLNRRVLGHPQDSPDVQTPVQKVVSTLVKVRKGGSAEACMLFPLFTAGCEARDTSHRHILLERVKSVETSGMTQVHKARALMERVWETGMPWETLIQGEFFG